MRDPPSQVRRSSSFSRPSTPSQTGRPACEQRPRPRRHDAQGGLPLRRDPSGVEIGVSSPRAIAVVDRHVEAAARPVLRQVLPEIRQLQRGAHRVRGEVERRIVVAGDAEHEPSHRVGRSRAIVDQALPRRIPLDGHVLPEGADQIVEQLDRQPVPPNRVAQSHEHGIVRRRRDIAARRHGAGVQTAAPLIERVETLRRGHVAFVREIVGAAARTHRWPRSTAASRAAAGARPPESSRNGCAPAARRRRRPRRAASGGLRSRSCSPLDLGYPARWFASLASVNSRSESRLT